MNDTWHIPRASLGSSSSGSSSTDSSKSHSNPPTVSKNFKNSPTAIHQQQLHHHHHHHHHHSRNHRSNDGQLNTLSSRDNRRKGRNYNHYQHYHQYKNYSSLGRKHRGESVIENGGRRATNNNNISKRGSRSSQGSTDSNNSSHSASSGSMLLTAANLERFAEIQNKHQNLTRTGRTSNYIANIKSPATTSTVTSPSSKANNDTILEIDPISECGAHTTKDADTVSIASSTHFTMVNGEGGPRKIKEGICSRGRQVTVLILSMSTVFLIGIMGMVYALEMRAREMPQS